jgi:hypothetical protein
LGRGQNAGHFVRIVSAPTQHAQDGESNLVGGGRRIIVEQCGAAHDHAGRAHAALTTHLVDEPLLHRVQDAVFLQTFDGCDLAPHRVLGEREAGIDRLTVHQHRAGAALAEVAALFRAGQAQVLPQREQQRVLIGHRDADGLAVDLELDRGVLRGAVVRLLIRMNPLGVVREHGPDPRQSGGPYGSAGQSL